MAYQGQVKSFGGSRGYGFIACPDIDGDVYFQRRDLPTDLQVNFSDDFFSINGLTVFFELTQTQDGKPQARNVKVIGGDGVNMIGEVKNYGALKGYGFITTTMLDGDLYFKGKDFPPGMQNMDLKGMKVKFMASTMKDGKMQARNIDVIAGGTPMPAMGNALAAMAAMGMPMHSMPPAPAPMPMGMGQARQARPAMPSAREGRPPRPMPSGRPAARSEPMVAAPAPIMGHTIPDGTSMVGTVKTFDPAKGYGFIAAPNFPHDIYFKPDQEAMTTGQQVTFIIKWTQDGKPQAREVTSPMQVGDILVGTVKRYNPVKGFGFLAVEGRPQDVYFQKRDVPDHLQDSSSLEGAQLRFTVRLTADGKPQAQDTELMAMPQQGMKRPAPGGFTAMNGGAAKRLRPSPTTAAPQAMAYGDIGGYDEGYGGGGVARGQVKSFNSQKGFGFIQCQSVPGDVYFQKSALPMQFREANLSGKQVSFELKFTGDGKAQASNVQVGR